MSKKCKFPKCGTKLTKLNKADFCFLHRRVLHQHEIYFRDRKFWGDDNVPHTEKNIKKGKKRPLQKVIISSLKELIPFEEVLSAGRL